MLVYKAPGEVCGCAQANVRAFNRVGLLGSRCPAASASEHGSGVTLRCILNSECEFLQRKERFKMSKGKNLSRRDFIKSATIASTAVAASTVLGATPVLSSTNVPQKWDYEADVVIIGAGTAGLPAGIEAGRAGVKALVLESEPVGGGAYLVSGGITAWAKKGEEKDFHAFLNNQLVGNGSDPELIKVYAYKSPAIFDLLKEIGAPPTKEEPTYSVPPETVPKGIRTNFAYYTDRPKVYASLVDCLKKKGGNIQFNHRARRLIMNRKGEVIGLQGERKGKKTYIKANRAVILASGGFGQNRKLLKMWGGPVAAAQIPRVPPSHQGDGYLMSMELGANIVNQFEGTTGYQGSAVTLKGNMALYYLNYISLSVNKEGKRFINEAVHYSTLASAILQQTDVTQYLVFDRDILEEAKKNPMYPALDNYYKLDDSGEIIKADTIEKLAEAMGLSPKVLKSTVDKYNGYVAAGADEPEFGKAKKYLRAIKTAPFCGVLAKPSIILSRPGAEIDINGHVKNVFGETIPRLYAAGNMAGGFFVRSYCSGTAIGSGIMMGLITGQNAAAEKPWK